MAAFLEGGLLTDERNHILACTLLKVGAFTQMLYAQKWNTRKQEAGTTTHSDKGTAVETGGAIPVHPSPLGQVAVVWGLCLYGSLEQRKQAVSLPGPGGMTIICIWKTNHGCNPCWILFTLLTTQAGSTYSQ